MNKWGSSTAIAAMTLLIGFLLVSIVAASVITNGSGSTTSEQDVEEILNDVLDEISTYIQIKDKIGKYYTTNGIARIEKIAILVKPLITIDIDISQLNIKLCDGKLLDKDNSLVDHDILNEDMAYIIIKLPEDFSMVKKEAMTLTLFPESGIERTITLKAPPPLKPIVSFE